jgi:hypothetical protein
VEVHLASKTLSEAFSVFDMTLLVTEECPMMQQEKKEMKSAASSV